MDYGNQTNSQQTFGRQLMSYVSSKLPYAGFSMLDFTTQKNPKFKVFEETGIRRAEALSRQSITQSNPHNNENYGEFKNIGFGDVLYANLQNDKTDRIQDYRTMAAFAEVANALDEMCDEIINKDGEGNIVKLTFRNIELKADQQEYMCREFQKYIEFFDLENKGWGYFRDLLVEGEVYFEQIIHKDYINKGVLGIVRVPVELVDPVYSNIQNMMVKGYLYRKPMFDPQNARKKIGEEFIPLEDNQIVYVNSGIWNSNKTVRLPFIENARRAYRQLSLIEDAIVIYRLVRAPERLVFNVDVGNMAPPRAEAYLRKLIQQYWSSKTFDVNQNSTVQKFNPQSMLDSFWFAKRTGSDGTSVSQLAGGMNLGEITDLMYFVKKLYEALKVPVNRLDPSSAYTDGSNILREELKFARFIMRIQQLFAGALKRSFISHLQLKEKWKDSGIKEYNLHVEFNPPTNFYELRESQRLDLKVSTFNNIASNASISPTYMQKRILGWTEVDIKANREMLRKDTELEWEKAQIMQFGPEWQKLLAAGAGQPQEGGGMEGMPSMGGGGGGGGMPPDFGGGDASTEPAAGGAIPGAEGSTLPAQPTAPAPGQPPPA